MEMYWCMSGLFLLTLLSDHVVTHVSAENIEGGNSTSSSARGGKLVFNVVRFPNSACSGTNSLNGTCYTASECSSKSGTAAGSCASGFGVCCTFSISCGTSSSENNTYAIISTYSTSTDSDPCIYTFCRRNANICKLRIDFESFTTAPPQGYVAEATATATAFSNSFRLGQCVNDVVKITNPGGPSPPTICGVNTGQHMWVPASSACNQINIDVDTGKTTPRSWTISVKQFECGSTSMPQDDCLQYHTGTSGQFYSFAWDKSVTTLTTTSHTHLARQYYDICFRRERGYCSLCFTPYITSAIAATYTSFGVSTSGDAAASQSALSTLCGKSAAGTTEANQDYIEVVNLQATIGTTNTAGANKICGQKFAGADGATVPATACTWSSPFRWGVRFSDSEGLAITATATPANNEYENEGVGGNGYMGFYMDWWQNTC